MEGALLADVEPLRIGSFVYVKIWSVATRLEARGEGNEGGLGYAWLEVGDGEGYG